MKAALLRVGIDLGCGGFISPLFDDDTFELIYIPEPFPFSKMNSNSLYTYSTFMGRTGKLLHEYFDNQNHKNKMTSKIIHVDPDFEGFTYGDPCFNKARLAQLNEGDYLIFYAGLKRKAEKSHFLYLVGFFEIQNAIAVKDLKDRKDLLKYYSTNFHVKHEEIFLRDVTYQKNRGLKLVKGSERSRLFKKAYKLTELKPYKKLKHPVNVLSKDMQKIFGNLNGRIFLGRNALRMIEDPRTVKRIKAYIDGLE